MDWNNIYKANARNDICFMNEISIRYKYAYFLKEKWKLEMPDDCTCIQIQMTKKPVSKKS